MNRFVNRALVAAILLCGPVLLAGTESYDYKQAPPTITHAEPWQFTIAIPGWLASTNGTIGINGVDANIDVPVSDILQHFDAILAGRVEAQKGPFGIYGESIYIGLSDVAEVKGLINNIHETADSIFFDGALSWRFVNQPRWWLDFTAGTHYANVYEQLTLNGDVVQIHQTSKLFVTNISDDLEARLNNDISNSQFLAALTSTIESDIVSRIDPHGALDRHQRNPRILIGPLGGRIHEDVSNDVEDFIQAKEAALRIRINALHLIGDARRAAVHRIVAAAEAKIADQLASVLDTKFHQTISRVDDWFDPDVGLRWRYNFNRTYYTAVRGEIGGFGVGADLMWQVEAMLGVNLTRNIFTEVGYRAFGADFENDNFRFDVVLHGPQITTGITF
jgi:hypothetical protein